MPGKGSSWEEEVFLELRKMIRKVEIGNYQYSHYLQKNYGITRQQISVLKFINANSGISLSKLALGIGSHITTVEGIVNRLHKKSLIRKSRNKTDKRIVEVGITGKGKKIIEDAPLGPMAHLLMNLKKTPRKNIELMHKGIATFVELCGASTIKVEPEEEIVQTTIHSLHEIDKEKL